MHKQEDGAWGGDSSKKLIFTADRSGRMASTWFGWTYDLNTTLKGG